MYVLFLSESIKFLSISSSFKELVASAMKSGLKVQAHMLPFHESHNSARS